MRSFASPPADLTDAFLQISASSLSIRSTSETRQARLCCGGDAKRRTRRACPSISTRPKVRFAPFHSQRSATNDLRAVGIPVYERAGFEPFGPPHVSKIDPQHVVRSVSLAELDFLR